MGALFLAAHQAQRSRSRAAALFELSELTKSAHAARFDRSAPTALPARGRFDQSGRRQKICQAEFA
jgi:hypothetical protein